MTVTALLMANQEELQESIWLQLQKQQNRALLRIFTVGKAGVGKSSLIRDLIGPKAKRKPAVAAGWDPCTMKLSPYDIPVGDGVSVHVYDTRGMFDAGPGSHEDTTANRLREVCSNDVSGVLIVCIPMHERLDEAALETLTILHNIIGSDIWRYTVIALTKADQYPQAEWLDSKKWFNKSAPIIKSEFEKSLNNCKKILREKFTLSEDESRRGCYIGMTEEEYDELEIPIVPTSTLTKDLSKMTIVGHEHWFDMLLVECCKRERGMTLVNIHSERLVSLPDEIVREITGKVGPEFIMLVKKFMKSMGEKTCLLIAWNIYQHYKYTCRVVHAPRFEPTKNADIQRESTKH